MPDNKTKDLIDEIHELTQPNPPTPSPTPTPSLAPAPVAASVAVYHAVTSLDLLQRHCTTTTSSGSSSGNGSSGSSEQEQEHYTMIARECYDPATLTPFSVAMKKEGGSVEYSDSGSVEDSVEYSVEYSVGNISKFVNHMTGVMYAKEILHIRQQCRVQCDQCPGSISLTLHEYSMSSDVSRYSYVVHYLDSAWVRQEYFLGMSPQVTPGDLSACQQLLGSHLTQVLKELYDIKPSVDIFSLQFSGESHVSPNSQAIATAVANQLGIKYAHVNFFSELKLIVDSLLYGDSKVRKVGEMLQKAAKLAEYFHPNNSSASQLKKLLCHPRDEAVYPIVQHDGNLCCVTDCMISLLNTRGCINEYFRQRGDDSQSLSLAPTLVDWEQWAAIVSILEPVRRFALAIRQCADPTLSNMWYLVDWIVCIYEESEAWEVLDVSSGFKFCFKQAQLSPSCTDFRVKFAEKCRERFLSADMKPSQNNLYSLHCQATLLDSRYKDFKFFKTLTAVDDDDDSSDSGDKHDDDEPGDNFNDNALVHGSELLRESMKAELQAVHSSQLPSVKEHRLFRIVDSMFVGKQDYASILGKRKPGEGEWVITDEIKQKFFQEKMNKYAELELRQYLRLAPSRRGQTVQLDRTLPFWQRNSVQFAITSHFARKFLAIQMISCTNAKAHSICKTIYEKDYEIDASSTGLLDCIIFLAYNSPRE